jgi:hypothetical protein
VEKYGTEPQAANDNIILRMRFACWITKAIRTHVIINTYCFSTSTISQRTCYHVTFICTLPILLNIS